MGFIDKVKGFFYDEEEIEEEVEVPVKRELPKKKPIILEDEEKKKEIPERELFKAERTFNFPMDMDEDEPDFMPVEKSLKEEKNSSEEIKTKKTSHSYNTNSSSYRSPSNVKPKVETEKKFKPTPIISPIYGIIEGEYVKNDNKEDSLLGETKEFGITKKIDFDTVRQKAYGKINNDDIDDNDKDEEKKGIFFNLVDDEKEDEKNITSENELNEDDEIKITYNDVDYDDEDDEEEIEVPKITRIKKNNSSQKEEIEEDAILSETKEQDLFNLIDNMYNSEEEDDE